MTPDDSTHLLLEETRELIDLLIDGRLSEPARSRLERLVIEHPAAADLYLDYMLLQVAVQAHSPGLTQKQLLGQLQAQDDVDAGLSLKPNLWRVPLAHRWLGAAAAALLLLLGGAIVVGVVLRMRGHAPATSAGTAATERYASARLMGAAGARWESASATIDVGSPISNGQAIHLAGGVLELQMESGATVLLQGPAVLRVLDRNAVALDSGRLLATVPPAARGFRADAPGFSVVDLGTRFGLLVDANGGQRPAEVHVFEGHVTVIPNAGPPQSLVANDAVRFATASAAPTRIKVDSTLFAWHLQRIVQAIPLHNTGQYLTDHEPDPAWQVTALPGNPNFPPEPAKVFKRLKGIYPTGGSRASAWVIALAETKQAPGGNYTFTTTVDLTGVDAASAVVEAQVAVDNGLVDVLVNGQSTGMSIPDFPKGRLQYQPHLLKFTGLLRPGKNRVDFIVYNHPGSPAANRVGLRVDWHATGLTPLPH